MQRMRVVMGGDPMSLVRAQSLSPFFSLPFFDPDLRDARKEAAATARVPSDSELEHVLSAATSSSSVLPRRLPNLTGLMQWQEGPATVAAGRTQLVPSRIAYRNLWWKDAAAAAPGNITSLPSTLVVAYYIAREKKERCKERSNNYCGPSKPGNSSL
ncbi:hypothetical protein DAI22_08g049800 [Oryza sativa Japonica Group]|nr:hypothetical protein DAI22_08g049800 [Oryza sativa Japonica Group]